MQPIEISVINYKGGSAKTTLSINLAGYFAVQHKSKVLVVDLDPQQGSTMLATKAANKGNPLPFDVLKDNKKKADYDFVIYDHPPTNQIRNLSPFVLVPTILDANSFAPTLKTISDLRQTESEYMLVPFRVEQNKDQQMLLKDLTEKAESQDKKQPSVKQRAVYQRAANLSVSVYQTVKGELTKSDTWYARKEISAVADALGEMIKRKLTSKR